MDLPPRPRRCGVRVVSAATRARSLLVALLLTLLATLAPGMVPGSAAAEPTVSPIVGRITSSLDGSPVAGAEVDVSRYQPDDGGSYQGGFARTTTDADGRYRLDLPEGQYSLFFTHPQHSEASTAWGDGDVRVVAGGPPVVVDMVMRRLAEYTGVVRDAAGAPIPGATVTLWYEAYYGYGPVAIKTQRVGQDGRYEFFGRPLEAHRLSVAAAGHLVEFHRDAPDVESAQDIVGVPGPTRVDFALEPVGQGLGGRVTSSGRPAADVEVVVEWYQSGRPATEYARVLTAADGSWGVGAPAGSFRVSFSGEGVRQEWYQDAEVSSQARTVRVAAGARTTVDAEVVVVRSVVRGRVLADGQPLPSFDPPVVSLQPVDDPSVTFQVGVDPDGSYSLGGMPAGTYWVWVQRPEGDVWRTTYLGDVATPAESTPVELDGTSTVVADIDLLPGLPIPEPISGRVTGPGGRAVAGAEVRVEERPVGATTWTVSAVVTSTQDGLWGAPALPGHEYRVSFRHPGYRTQWFDGADRARDATIVLPGASGVDARLRPLPWWQRACQAPPRSSGLASLRPWWICALTVPRGTSS
ncbi:carboxypeptidase-like regulatory domain-containing protein [Nocardioides sp. 616]|uniref:MSCRAMM family protein n=1 Tax=Nocardioides sp. 616 TaxID=2268090 RepID=UPI000CE4CD12|nr:carboxypeptidase-like regulatory domain-containing protein [Nocardioides sp. 616]